MYGLKQAMREWFQKLTSQLVKLGFQGLKMDSSLYFTLTGPFYILIYVDDILVLGPSISQIQAQRPLSNSTSHHLSHVTLQAQRL